MSDNEYPHWKEALFGNGHVANLWCAIKYFVWHGAHLLLALLGLVLFLAIKAYQALDTAIGYAASDDSPLPNVNLKEKLTSELASNIAIGVFLLICAVWFGFVGYHIILFALANTIMFLAAIGGITLAVIAITVGGFLALVIEDKFGPKGKGKQAVTITGVKAAEKVGTVKEKSKETPLFRRLLGYCPVSMSMQPKWLDTFADSLAERI